MSRVRDARNPLDCSALSHSDNKRVSGSGFHPSPKSPSATSDTRRTLGVIGGDGLEDINKKKRSLTKKR